ncbi:MAG: hypothetical protein LBO73_04240 [Holosporaceae bacterium]|jgi:hypothetical protein|nr:hypothetical protein [Holosporaceae bacterium]
MKNATTKTILTLMSAVILAEEAEAGMSKADRLRLGLGITGIVAGVGAMVGGGIASYVTYKKADEANKKFEAQRQATAAAEVQAKSAVAETLMKAKKQNISDTMSRNEKQIDEVSGRLALSEKPDEQILGHLLDAATNVGRAKNDFLLTEWDKDVEKTKAIFVCMYAALQHLLAIKKSDDAKVLSGSITSMIDEVRRFCAENGIPQGGNLSHLMQDAENTARISIV